ncbi:MAG: 50S ribosomal protein L17 [Chlamydiae bacterium RIFCSPHIGHO2_12_FULL_44_59]|nr:MAG: 50S ribosomal protein L17 [Chlamydiae bacterium RIFCSPHIGHO2_01_FULL_44_39]OGN59043.1 MAG: 50S ribosomal protein L17 [Chlamydiae bacterium RIFCSPHIGHO2_02_FULL_45_9]OGN60547.1 MAG: 50S ribosomal protein L17 [Chlamydiae bacterium RIFCSPHIGHO2_12_FULL_44_59]OGN66002.1 MAG: 50S ribosomal protein L17 [Chlamydiae bacterium RIFCSPLOWO2_01_FULL_44_52]OGN68817.1 MAG: 50S ribosomal protein L17 [Chlamydiae bacterium RIFCSPLOWO2_02_FULL_45_22]OGN70457.1 MAG: 50S ribosomal protein L17 [Chlamydiae 
MRHAKRTFKVGRTGSHRRAMIANMVKALIENERIETTVTKAKELRRHADKMITCAKKNTLASKRNVIAALRVAFNPLTSKEARQAKSGNTNFHSRDRLIIHKLFGELRERFAPRNGGYTRIIRKGERVGDSAPTCYIEYLK